MESNTTIVSNDSLTDIADAANVISGLSGQMTVQQMTHRINLAEGKIFDLKTSIGTATEADSVKDIVDCGRHFDSMMSRLSDVYESLKFALGYSGGISFGDLIDRADELRPGVTMSSYVVLGGDDVKLYIPKEMRAIPSSAFANCSSLKYAYISELVYEVFSIGDSAFEGCENMYDINFNSAGSIGDRAFCGCTALGSDDTLSMARVESVGQGAFEGCSSLNNASLPKLSSIGAGAFSGCELYSLYIDSMPYDDVVGNASLWGIRPGCSVYCKGASGRVMYSVPRR